ncbi:MAG: tRNA pseudouridine(13) synthase TruD [Gammaproteobacteria bacterium]|nr:tRNA pseudouridine(13) synthase TruD [Gammaproteobacteria bacterium]
MADNNYLFNESDLSYAWGGPAGTAELKSDAADFRVTELLDFTPTESGEHLWLWIEKRGLNTQWLAGQIARWAGVRPMDVGYAGLKDRHGITQQWFSIYLPQKPSLSSVELESIPLNAGESFSVLRQHWHSQKLRRGNNRGNRFEITLRDVVADRENLERIIADVVANGVPNYFGAQRFGKFGDNVAQFLAKGAKPQRHRGKGKPPQEDILLSAGRSWLFNHVLSQRVGSSSWIVPQHGDVMMLNGTQSIFLAEQADEVIRERHQQHDIHITGPMWGTGELRCQGLTQQLESSTASSMQPLTDLLCKAGLKQERRSLRLLVDSLEYHWENDHLCLIFDLPSGAYATTVLREMLRCQLPA